MRGVPVSAVYLYAPCGLSKRSDEVPLSLYRIAGKPRPDAADERAATWVRTAWSSELSRRPFEETYSGGFWGLLRKTPPAPYIHVCAVSAGFGLLSPGSLIPNYDATFAVGLRNSVGIDAKQNREWWRILGIHAARNARVQGFAESIRRRPGTHIIALPQLYLDAVWEDVREAIDDIRLQKRVVVLTTPYSGNAFASPRSLTVTSGIRAELGGTIGTILPRLALRIANTLSDRASDLAAIAGLVAGMRTEEALSPLRKKLSDEKIRLFILRFLRDYPTAEGYTSALRLLRAKGLACEMKRFRTIFKETYKSIHA